MTPYASKGPPVNRILGLLTVPTLAAFSIGCAGKGMPAPTATPEPVPTAIAAVPEPVEEAPPPVDREAIDALYDRLADGMFVYRRGVELLASSPIWRIA